MSECDKCGITDNEITPKKIKQYLGEKPQPKKNIDFYKSYWEQTDRMFFVEDFQIFCKRCK